MYGIEIVCPTMRLDINDAPTESSEQLYARVDRTLERLRGLEARRPGQGSRIGGRLSRIHRRALC